MVASGLLPWVNFINALMPKFVPQNAKKNVVLTFQFYNTYWAVTMPKMVNKVAQNWQQTFKAFSRLLENACVKTPALKPPYLVT